MEKGIPNKRPGIITAVCVLGFLNVPLILFDISTSRGVEQVFGSILGLICTVGLWKMKKWSVIAYTTLVGINHIVLMGMGFWNIFTLIIPGIIIAIGLWNYKLMD